MDILFVTSTDKLKLNRVTNGTMLLGTKLIDAGFSVDIVRFAQFGSHRKDYKLFISEITDHIMAINPKCVSFYTLWPYYHIHLRIAKELKQRNKEIIIVFGGPHSSATAEETMKTFADVDYVCAGEGENTVVPFFTEILRNGSADLASIPGLYYRQGGEVIKNTQEITLCNLDELPNWNDSLISSWDPNEEEDIHSSKYYMPIDVGRGCPFGCTFCSTSRFWRRTYRLKSAQSIIDDILYYYNKYGIRSFLFSHDVFTTNTKLVSEVCDKIIENNLNIRWSCTTRIDCLKEELVLKMIRSGLKAINVGVETGSPRMQKIINKRLNLEHAKEMVSFLVKNKLVVGLNFMYGFPEETEEDLNQTLELIFDCLEMGINQAIMNICHFSPATVMTNENLDKLVFDTDCKIRFRGIFGYQEEIETFKSNKKIFSTFYNLKTELRIEYQNLFHLVYFYEKYKSSMPFLRRYYRGDNLAMYKAFNKHILAFLHQEKDPEVKVKDRAFGIIRNTIREMEEPFARQLLAIFHFEYDWNEVKQSKTDYSIRKVYDFSYLDYLEKIPIEEFTDYKSELLIQKKDGKLRVDMLDIRPFEEA